MRRIYVQALRYALALSAMGIVAPASIAAGLETSPLALALRNINGTQDLGRRSGGEPVEVTLTLHRNHEAELQQLIQKQHELGSPAYHHFLTSEEFDRDFAPTTAQLEYVTGALRNAGFQVERTSADRTVVTAGAPSGIVENFFRTEIHSVRQSSEQVRYANASPITILFHLSGAVAGVRINNVVLARVMHERANKGPILPERATTEATPEAAHPNALGSPYGISGYALPGAIAVSFDLPVQHSFPGTGHTAAIVIDSDLDCFQR